MTSKSDQRRQVTEAFRQYAARGKNPNHAEMLDAETWLSDTAVSMTLSVLRAESKTIVIEAVEAIYFANPSAPLQKNDIEYRVTNFCITHYVARSTVYGWLSAARRIYMAIRDHQDKGGAS